MGKKEERIDFWNELRAVPDAAKKTIAGGKLKGMTDINPVWRMQIMNSVFGMCGFGWKYEVVSQWLEPSGEDDVKAFCNINLYVKVDGQWSDAIPGTGGSTFVQNRVSNDEAHKMALTDALSVAMKAIGVAADVYFAKGADYGTKYEQRVAEPAPAKKEEPKKEQPKKAITEMTDDEIDAMCIKAIEENRLDDAVSILKQTFIKKAETKPRLLWIYAHYEKLQGYKSFMDNLTNRKKELGLC